MLPPRRPYSRKSRSGALRSDIHRKFVRRHECIVWGNPHSPCDTHHPVECAHIRTAANSGIGVKPGDEWTVSLCRSHHSETHAHGDITFERKYGVNLAAMALEFAASSPDKEVKARVRELDLRAVLEKHIGAEV